MHATPLPKLGRCGRRCRAWLAVMCGWALWVGVVGAAEAARVISFGTVERLTPRGAPIRGLDDAAFDQDLAELVAKAAGLPFRIREYKTAPEVIAAFERGEVDVIPSMARLPEREGKYLFSVRHTVSSAAVFRRVGAKAPESLEQVAALRLGVVRNSSPYSYLRRKGWLERAEVYATTEEVLQAVEAGTVEAGLSNQLIGLSVLRQMKWERRIAPVYTLPDFSVEFCMAVRPADAELLGRLNDGLLLASERGDLRRHREKWLPVFESYWLSRQGVRWWFGVGGAALLLAAGLSWVWYRERLRAERKRTQDVQRMVAERTAELEATNRQLRASEELFATAFRASPDAMSITRVADGRLVDVNGAFTRIFGHTRDEAIGRTREELGLWRAEEHTALRPTLQREGRVREAVQRVHCQDGREIEVLFSTELTQVGGEECSVTISRDITEQKHAMDELRRGHAFNEAILNTADGLIVVLDRHGRIVRFNPACERLTGWHSAEVLGRCFWEFLVPPEQVAGVQATFAALSAGMFPNRHENDWVARDGTRRWIAWANSALLDEAGGIELILGTGVDITGMRRMTEALRASEERYQLAVRGSSAGLWDWNLLTDEVFYAPRFREMLGYTDEGEFPAHPRAFFEALHPEDRVAVQAALAASQSMENAPYDAEYRLRTKAGEYRWFQARGEVLRDATGRPYRMAGSIVDITWRKEVERELRQLNAELEKRVRERTVELAQRVVEVEQLNADLESFSYSVSHDLRAPLRNITGFLELLATRATGRLDAEEKRYVATVTREAARLGALIDDLLTFSRMGREEMKHARVALAELVAEVRVELQPAIGERAIEWRNGELPLVRGDRALLRLVVSNLLANAVKFTRQRPLAVIEVGALGTQGNPVDDGADAAKGLVTFFVRDNGAGFNPKYGDKLFGVFQRLHNARDFEGSGIGLANVKRIVTRHGGRVWAEGAVGQGAVFYFSLPADEGSGVFRL